MKKILILLITFVFASIAMGVVTGCNSDGGESTHEHKYADAYTCHDRTCTVEDCGHVEKATTAHDFGEWQIVKEPTCTEEGLRERICSVCGDKESEKLATEHSFGDDGVCTHCHKNIKEFSLRLRPLPLTLP